MKCPHQGPKEGIIKPQLGKGKDFYQIERIESNQTDGKKELCQSSLVLINCFLINSGYFLD